MPYRLSKNPFLGQDGYDVMSEFGASKLLVLRNRDNVLAAGVMTTAKPKMGEYYLDYQRRFLKQGWSQAAVSLSLEAIHNPPPIRLGALGGKLVVDVGATPTRLFSQYTPAQFGKDYGDVIKAIVPLKVSETISQGGNWGCPSAEKAKAYLGRWKAAIQALNIGCAVEIELDTNARNAPHPFSTTGTHLRVSMPYFVGPPAGGSSDLGYVSMLVTFPKVLRGVREGSWSLSHRNYYGIGDDVEYPFGTTTVFFFVDNESLWPARVDVNKGRAVGSVSVTRPPNAIPFQSDSDLEKRMAASLAPFGTTWVAATGATLPAPVSRWHAARFGEFAVSPGYVLGLANHSGELTIICDSVEVGPASVEAIGHLTATMSVSGIVAQAQALADDTAVPEKDRVSARAMIAKVAAEGVTHVVYSRTGASVKTPADGLRSTEFYSKVIESGKDPATTPMFEHESDSRTIDEVSTIVSGVECGLVAFMDNRVGISVVNGSSTLIPSKYGVVLVKDDDLEEGSFIGDREDVIRAAAAGAVIQVESGDPQTVLLATLGISSWSMLQTMAASYTSPLLSDLPGWARFEPRDFERRGFVFADALSPDERARLAVTSTLGDTTTLFNHLVGSQAISLRSYLLRVQA